MDVSNGEGNDAAHGKHSDDEKQIKNELIVMPLKENLIDDYFS